METTIKKIREKIGLTQVEVSRRANIIKRSYQRYEAGECIPNVYTAIEIAKALNSTVEKCFTVNNDNRKQSSSQG